MFFDQIGYCLSLVWDCDDNHNLSLIMHIPKKFQQEDQDQLRTLIERWPLGTLVTPELEANHIPFVIMAIQDRYILQGHIAKVNPLWQSAIY